jgi:hypothetical protein
MTNTSKEETALATSIYLLLDQVQDAGFNGYPTDVSIDELDEIDQIRRIVMEVSGDQPTFMTST